MLEEISKLRIRFKHIRNNDVGLKTISLVGVEKQFALGTNYLRKTIIALLKIPGIEDFMLKRCMNSSVKYPQGMGHKTQSQSYIALTLEGVRALQAYARMCRPQSDTFTGSDGQYTPCMFGPMPRTELFGTGPVRQENALLTCDPVSLNDLESERILVMWQKLNLHNISHLEKWDDVKLEDGYIKVVCAHSEFVRLKSDIESLTDTKLYLPEGENTNCKYGDYDTVVISMDAMRFIQREILSKLPESTYARKSTFN